MNYHEIKSREMMRAEGFLFQCDRIENPYYIYKSLCRPITDLRHMMQTSVEKYADNIAFKQRFKKGEPFKEITYLEAMDDINGLGTSMAKLGLLGERVAVIGENCYQWATCYLATTMGGGVIVPLDKEIHSSDIKALLIESEAKAVMFTKKYKKIFSDIKASGDTSLEVFVNLDADEHTDDAYSWEILVNEGKKLVKAGERDYLDAEIIADEMGIMLFTSGTTGTSKTVMLSQSNICYDLMAISRVVRVLETDTSFLILPMHHTYACTGGFLAALYFGGCVAFSEGLKYLQKNMKELQPTVILGVPLIFEKLYTTIRKTIKKQGKEKTVERILKMNRTTSKIGLNLSKKLLKEITDVFGGKLRLIFSGGAAGNPEVLDFFNDLGVIAIQGYGLTETSPLVAINPDQRKYMRNESAGQILPGIESKIVDADEQGIGEICFRGPNVMMGYYNNPEETEKALIDGWFHTGDLGFIDEDNFVHITGRKKNVIITPNGKNVFPEEIEAHLEKIPYVEECMVWADSDEDGQDSVIVATIKPELEEVAAALGHETEDVKEIEKLMWEEVDKVNEKLASFKKIVRLQIRLEDFEKTTAHKIKRFIKSNRDA